jgi:hypothetical protein
LKTNLCKYLVTNCPFFDIIWMNPGQCITEKNTTRCKMAHKFRTLKLQILLCCAMILCAHLKILTLEISLFTGVYNVSQYGHSREHIDFSWDVFDTRWTIFTRLVCFVKFGRIFVNQSRFQVNLE